LCAVLTGTKFALLALSTTAVDLQHEIDHAAAHEVGRAKRSGCDSRQSGHPEQQLHDVVPHRYLKDAEQLAIASWPARLRWLYWGGDSNNETSYRRGGTPLRRHRGGTQQFPSPAIQALEPDGVDLPFLVRDDSDGEVSWRRANSRDRARVSLPRRLAMSR